PSGCGRSTILNMGAGRVEPTAGVIEIDGRAVTGVPANVGYVFQKDTVFPWRTVRRNIALGLEYRGIRGEAQERRVAAAVTMAGLEGLGRLSGDAVGRDAPARGARADADRRAADPPDGRAVRRARPAYQARAARGALAAVGRAAPDRGLHHPRSVRGHHAGRSHRRHDAPAGSDQDDLRREADPAARRHSPARD